MFGDTLGGLFGGMFDSMNNGIQAVIDYFSNLDSLSPGLRLGIGIAATVVSAVSIVGLPLLGITIPFIVQAGKDLKSGGSSSPSPLSSNSFSANNGSNILRQSMASTTFAATSLTDDLNTDIGTTPSIIVSSLPQSFVY